MFALKRFASTTHPAMGRRFPTTTASYYSQSSARRSFGTVPDDDLKSTVKKEPLTIPRVAVLAFAVAVIGTMLFRKGEKTEIQAEDKHNIIRQSVPPSPSKPVKKAADATKPLSAVNPESEKINKLPENDGITEKGGDRQ